MNNNNNFDLLSVKMFSMKRILKDIKNGYCDLDLFGENNELSEELYRRIGNDLKNLTEVSVNTEQFLKEKHDTYYKRPKGKTLLSKDSTELMQKIYMNICEKYDKLNVCTAIDMLYKDFGYMGLQIAKICEKYGEHVELRHCVFNDITNEKLSPD